jgi:cell division protein FtsN
LEKIINRKVVAGLCAVMLALAGCSRQQSDWQKTRETNTAEAYEQFLKKYPSGEFTAQAEARVKELYEERDWQKARDADTPEAYQAFVKQYPEGKWTEEARIRIENFTLAQAPSGAAGPAGGPATAGAGLAAEATEKAAPPAPAAKQTPEPDRRVAATPPLKAAAPKAEAKAAAGSYGVQLGAFKSGPEAAHKHWAELQKQYPVLLEGLSGKVLPTKTSGGNLYRLQTTGVTEQRARQICSSLKANSQGCVVVPHVGG